MTRWTWLRMANFLLVYVGISIAIIWWLGRQWFSHHHVAWQFGFTGFMYVVYWQVDNWILRQRNKSWAKS